MTPRQRSLIVDALTSVMVVERYADLTGERDLAHLRLAVENLRTVLHIESERQLGNELEHTERHDLAEEREA